MTKHERGVVGHETAMLEIPNSIPGRRMKDFHALVASLWWCGKSPRLSIAKRTS